MSKRKEFIEKLEEVRELAEELLGEADRAEPATPCDRNGELLEVGDLVSANRRFSYQFTKVDQQGEIWFQDIKDGWEGTLKPGWVKKLTSLTRDQYLPLARRTLSPDLTKKETLSMLTLGAMGEWEEWMSSKTAEELGDCLWYLTLLCDELNAFGYGAATGFSSPSAVVEVMKKYIYHDTHDAQAREMVWRWLCHAEDCAVLVGSTAEELRLQNIKKLLARYPEGFVTGGGER